MEQVVIEVGQQVRVAGPLGTVDRFKTAKVQDLLATIARSHPKPCRRTQLIAELWPGATPAAGRNSLSVALTSLQKLLDGVSDEPVIERNRSDVWLALGNVTVVIAQPDPSELHSASHESGYGLVGRENELARIRKLLDSPHVRLISIVAAGGMGKTALAKATIDSYPFAAVSFIEIHEAATEQLFAEALARSMGLGAGAFMPEVLRISSEMSPRLFVLDALEFYRDDPVVLIAQILKTPGKVLVTARRPIGAKNEYLVRLGHLGFKPKEGRRRSPASTMLFNCLEKYGVSPDEALPETNAERICCLLEGIPLAIEWAAHFLAFKGPAALARVIESGNIGLLPWSTALSWTYLNISEHARRLWLLLALCSCPLPNEVADLLIQTECLPEALPELLAYGVAVMEVSEGKSQIRVLDTMCEVAISNAPASEIASAETALCAFWVRWCELSGAQLRGPNPDSAIHQSAMMLPAITQSLRKASAAAWATAFLSLRPFFLVFGIPESVEQVASLHWQNPNSNDAIVLARLTAIYAYCLRPRDMERSDALGLAAIVSAIECDCTETLLIAVALAAHPKNRSSWKPLVELALARTPGSLWALEADYELAHQSSATQPPGTIENFERLLKEIQRTKYLLLEAPCLIELGYARLKRSQFAAAETALRRAMSLRERLGYGTDADLGLMAMSRANQGDYRLAIEIHRRILTTTYNFVMPPLRSHTAARLLTHYLEANRVDEAEADWQYCVDIMRTAPDEFTEFTIVLLHVFHERLREQPMAALNRLKRLKRELAARKSSRLTAYFEDEIRTELGSCMASLGRFNDAVKEVLPALRSGLELRKPSAVVLAMDAMAFINQARGDLSGAVEWVGCADLMLKWSGLQRSPARRKFLMRTIDNMTSAVTTRASLEETLAHALCAVKEKNEISAELMFD